MSTEPQTFKLYGPTGELIMHGALSQVMETLPDTKARSAALADMLKVAADSVAAEERADEARASAAQILSDGVLHLMHRLDSFEKHRALSAKRAEAERQRRDRQRVEAYKDTWPDPDDEPYAFDRKERTPADQDPEGIIPSPTDPTGAALADEGPQDPNEMGAVYDPKPEPEPGSRLYPAHPGIPQPTSISLNSDGV
jgi:hypothetical protein